MTDAVLLEALRVAAEQIEIMKTQLLIRRDRITSLKLADMEMKQTIANKEAEIERLGANVEQMQKDLDLVYAHDSNLVDHLKGWK
jgi:hypothetical protein